MGETSLIYLSHLIALERKLDSVANNVANAETTGFRTHQVSFQEYLSPAKEGEPGKKERPVSLVSASGEIPSAAQGALDATGNPLDLAIAGGGYFVIQTPQGERFTRAGAFTLNSLGQLVTLTGQPVLSKSGPIQVLPNEGPLTVASDGTVSSRQRILGSLRLVRFSQPVQAIGSNMYSANGTPTEIASGDVRLTVGALEKSNVQTTVEMSRLSEITRAYEATSALLKNSQNSDDLAKLARVPD